MNKLMKLGVLVLCAILVVLLYLPALSGALYYDDYSNLNGLSQVNSWSSAWQFVYGGHAGPLGRPVALLSFLPFSSGWPENSSSILLFNVILHAFNFLLLVLIGNALLNQATSMNASLRFRIALASGLMWAVLPIIASTSLIAIQRMTGLSAFFGLLGLLGFIAAYSVTERRPALGVILQFVALGAGTVLSIFAKESGALFPVYALIIDLAIVGKLSARTSKKYIIIRRSILFLPLLFLIYYISPVRIDWMALNEYRGGTPFQRLMTEFHILWEYLFKSFVPQSPTAYGPFHDHYGYRGVELATVVAGIAWGVVLAFAFVLRKRFKWFSFAVFWFLAGHIIESTTIMLELYFEHRNYIAVYGLCLFVSLSAFTLQGRLKRIMPILLAVYIALLSCILLSITILWGQPKNAAESWNLRHPGSARAALHAVFIENSDDIKALQENNSEYLERERMSFALKVLDRTKAACPDCLDIRIQALMYSCSLTSSADIHERKEEIFSIAPTAGVNETVVDQLFNLSKIIEAKACDPFTFQDLIMLIDRMSTAGKIGVPEYGAKIYFVRAMAQQALGQATEVEVSLARAEKISPEALPVLQYQVYFALEQNELELAQAALNRRTANTAARESIPADELRTLQDAINQSIQAKER